MANIYSTGTLTSSSDLTSLLKFANNAMLLNINTVMLCKVVEKTSDNKFTLIVATNPLNTTGTPLNPPTIYNVSSMLIMGGTAGIYVNYKAGDLVVVACTQRDNSSTIENQDISTPTTQRKFNIADAIILGKVPNELPTTIINIDEDDITIQSETVTIEADNIFLGEAASNNVLLQNRPITVNIAGVQAGAGVTGVVLTATAGGSSVVKAAV